LERKRARWHDGKRVLKWDLATFHFVEMKFRSEPMYEYVIPKKGWSPARPWFTNLLKLELFGL
jgi:hypothetical protein